MLGLYAQTRSRVASMICWLKLSMGKSSSRMCSGTWLISKSSPTHKRLRFAREALSRRSLNFTGHLGGASRTRVAQKRSRERKEKIDRALRAALPLNTRCRLAPKPGWDSMGDDFD